VSRLRRPARLRVHVSSAFGCYHIGAISHVPRMQLVIPDNPTLSGPTVFVRRAGMTYSMRPTMGAVALFQGSMSFSLMSHWPSTLTQVST
jgi:hypothetical protein